MKNRGLQGIIPAMVTPLTPDGKVDEEAVGRLVAFLIGKGVHGLFAVGSTGECAYLDTPMRKKMAESAIRSAGGKVPVVVHVSASRIEDVVDLIRHALEAGGDAIAITPPYYYSLDEVALETYFSRVAEVAEIPIYLYNIPMNAKNAISIPLFSRLSERYPHIMGLKDSSMDFDNFTRLVRTKRSSQSALMGNDAQILPALCVGGTGAVSAGATAIPEPYIALYDAFVENDFERARKWQNVCAAVKKMFVKPYPVAPQKRVLEMRGICGPLVQPPLRQMDRRENEELEEAYREIEQLLNE